ncbi:uncharacterized protein PV07_08102 [Cladophialophora immunda]|uniref:Uncharacterized protein n=1 Tax=Cladophialophora immunda TaxID=569365 RepID=A0A0D1ZKB7_9EURO|nr:uncharacterized protein PV07_08102 [Cladophialophora immunda]KIW28436.1 hypothetical protein PV07_08102 [Cladophialophora immunda]OQU95017.1 hypothetical protein CLAIMM_01286 [Cladophialophora immunda]
MDDHTSLAMQPIPEETVEIPLHLLRWLLAELDECARSMHADIFRQSTSPSPSPSSPHFHGDDVVHLPSTDFRPYSEMPTPGVTLPGDFRISLDGAEVQRLITCALTAIRGLSARYFQLLDCWKTLGFQCQRTKAAGVDLVTGLCDERDSIKKGSRDDLESLKERIQGKIDRLVERYFKAIKAAEGESDG